MLPYRRQGEIDYASLDFDPDVTDPPEDAMEQNEELNEIHNLRRAYVVDFGGRFNVFLDRETNICYDPRNLNVRIAPDLYLAFGVDAEAIRPRRRRSKVSVKGYVILNRAVKEKLFLHLAVQRNTSLL